MLNAVRLAWARRRNALFATPAFQRWAFAVPGMRQLALGETRHVFDLCAGFVYSQVLAACVRLDLFEMLAPGPLTLTVIAARCALPPASLERLLTAAVALRLVEPFARERYGLTMRGIAIAADPSIAAMVRHHATLYADLADPVALLRADKPATAMAAYWPYAGGRPRQDVQAVAAHTGGDGGEPQSGGDDRASAYSELMATSQAMIATQVLAAYDFTAHRRLLDVGGGNGAFASAVAARAPHLELALFDLPAVAALAAARFAREGLAHRALATGGDFYSDPLPGGADVVVLVRVLFDHDDAGASTILKAIAAALAPGGTLLIVEPMASARADPITDAYFNFYLLAMGRGRIRSPAHFATLLAAAGFAAPRPIPTRNPLLTGMLAVTLQKTAGQL